MREKLNRLYLDNHERTILLHNPVELKNQLIQQGRFKDGELEKDSVVKEYLTTGADGKNYKTKFYNLDVIFSVGYRVKSQRGVQFRIWATNVLIECG